MEIRRRILRLKQEFAPDLIHINGIGLIDFYHLATKQSHEIPVLVTLHGDWIPRIDGLAKQVLSGADWVVGCSAAILERGRQLTPEISNRCSIIYNAVEPTVTAPGPLPLDPPRILCLGRLSAEKGMDVALEALRFLLKRFPHVRLTIAGDGPMRFDLEAQVNQTGIGHAVDIVGWIVPERVSDFINGHTIVLMPSRQDSLPLVALQAALMARPVVATRVGGLPEIVVDQQTGLLVEADNGRALAEAVEILLSDPETATRYGQNARQRVIELFSWERHVEGYDAIYRKLLSAKLNHLMNERFQESR